MTRSEPITLTLTPDQVSVIDCALLDRRHALADALAEHPGRVTAYDRLWTAAEERRLDDIAALLQAAAAAPAPSRWERWTARLAARSTALRSPLPLVRERPDVR
jgi:hypothetical protein